MKHDPLMELAVYKSISGEFEDRTQQETAELYDITIYKVRQIMEGLEARCPKLFPLLSRREHEINQLRKAGLNTEAIAVVLNVSERRVQYVYNQLTEKGRTEAKRPKTVSYSPDMDSHIKEKY